MYSICVCVCMLFERYQGLQEHTPTVSEFTLRAEEKTLLRHPLEFLRLKSAPRLQCTFRRLRIANLRIRLRYLSISAESHTLKFPLCDCNIHKDTTTYRTNQSDLVTLKCRPQQQHHYGSLHVTTCFGIPV